MQYKLLRQSYIILVMRLLVLDLLITMLYLFFRIPSMFLPALNASNSVISGINIFGIIYFIFITLMESALSVWIVLSWANEEWEIKEGVIYHRRGVFHRREDAYSLKHIGSITLNQGLIGRLLNYGTVRIFSPFLKQDYYLMNTHNPKEIVKTLEDEVAGSNPKHHPNILFKKS